MSLFLSFPHKRQKERRKSEDIFSILSRYLTRLLTLFPHWQLTTQSTKSTKSNVSLLAIGHNLTPLTLHIFSLTLSSPTPTTSQFTLHRTLSQKTHRKSSLKISLTQTLVSLSAHTIKTLSLPSLISHTKHLHSPSLTKLSLKTKKKRKPSKHRLSSLRRPLAPTKPHKLSAQPPCKSPHHHQTTVKTPNPSINSPKLLRIRRNNSDARDLFWRGDFPHLTGRKR